MPFLYVEVAGSPVEMGFQHGRIASEQVHGFLEYLIRSSGFPREEVLAATRYFLPRFEQYCPRLLDEVRGLAEGAQISFEEAALLQIRGEIMTPLRGNLPEPGCTTFAVLGRHTREGGLLIGQTSDMTAEMEQYFLVLRLQPENAPAVLMWTFAGQLGYHGVSEAGIAHFANSLSGGPAAVEVPAGESSTGRPLAAGLPHYPVKRRLYECRTRDEVLALWRSTPVVSSGNYMIAAGGGILDVEATPQGVAVLEERGAGYLAHSNHFLSEKYRTAETDALSLRDSFGRYSRMSELLRASLGQLDVERMKAILSDHEQHPCSICRHETDSGERMVTVGGLIAEPDAGRLHVSRGNPCRGDWTTYRLHAQ